MYYRSTGAASGDSGGDRLRGARLIRTPEMSTPKPGRPAPSSIGRWGRTPEVVGLLIVLPSLVLSQSVASAGFGAASTAFGWVGPGEGPSIGHPAGGGATAVSAEYRPGSFAALGGLSILNFSLVPASVVRGAESNLSVATSGGTGALSFAYSNLPVGCYSLNGSKFPCFPYQVGRFTIEVQVTDSVGDVAYAETNLTVTSGHGPAPDVTSFGATPSTVKLGQTTYITVAAVSESSTPTAFLAYAFFDLPQGCASFNQTNLTCVPKQAGTFTIQVEVTDGFGSYTFAKATLTVTGGSSGSGSSGSSVPAWSFGGIVAAAGIVVAIGVFLHLRRSSR